MELAIDKKAQLTLAGVEADGMCVSRGGVCV